MSKTHERHECYRWYIRHRDMARASRKAGNKQACHYHWHQARSFMAIALKMF